MIRGMWSICMSVLVGVALCGSWCHASPASSASASAAPEITVSPHTPVVLHYNLPAKELVTLVINDSHGRRVKNLLGAAPRQAGPQTQVWDGTNDQGRAVPAGHYQWQMLYDRGIGLKYKITYSNPGNPPWATRDGSGGWGSDHTDPEAVAVAGHTVILGWPMAENGWYLIGVNQQGRKQWGIRNRFAFGDLNIALATRGGYLYVASEQNPASLMHYYKKMAHLVLYRYRLRDQRLIRLGRRNEIIISNQMGGNLQGLAVVGDIAYVSLSKQNRIAAVSLRQGRLLPQKDIPLAHPGPLAAAKNGDLLVLSADQVLRVDPATHQSTVLIAGGLEYPSAICVDAAGTIYVACRGHQQQVLKFNAAGRLLGTIGVKGGRPSRGFSNPQGMYRPQGIAVDKLGRLWVMEQDDRPKRTSVWNTQTGRLIREFIGAPHYGAMQGCIAPFDKTMAFGEGVEYHLHWNARGFGPQDYRYVATVSRQIGADDAFGGNFPQQIWKYHGRLITASGNHVEVISELKDGYLHPLAALGSIDSLTVRQGMLTGAIAKALPELKAAGAKVARGANLPMASFIWVDRNGDGVPQPSEITWKRNFSWVAYLSNSVDRHLTIFMQGPGVVYRLPVTGWTTGGAPIYSFKSMTSMAYTGFVESGMAVSPDGSTVIVNARPQLQGIDVRTGKVRWSYPNPWASVHGSHTANIPAPGRLIGPDSITGFAHIGGQVGTLFAMNGNLGQQFLMTTDGLWVAALFHDWRFAHGEGMFSIPDEDFGGYFWKDQASGHVYMEVGKDDYRIFRVTGLSTVRRSEGEFALTPAEASAAQALVAARHAPRKNVRTVAVARLTAPLPITGNLAALPASLKFTVVKANADNQFRFALGYDHKYMFLVYNVTDYRGFENTGRAWYRMFKSGDCVDLMLGTNPHANPQRQSGVAGDERLLLTLYDKKPLAVLYKQVDPTQAWPAAFVSPSRAVYFGSVRKVPDVRMVVKRIPTGYVVMVRVPLAPLGIKPARSLTLTGDVGVIYGSASGGSARLRLYWSNKDTAITSDVPSEAALQPNQWGRLIFK